LSWTRLTTTEARRHRETAYTTTLACALAACHFAAAPLLAQTPEVGTIRGVVLDTRGGTPLRRVAVRLQADGRTTQTDDEGRFAIGDVPVGDQELYVSAVDFILVKRTVAVRAGATSEVTIVLSEGTGTYTETVNVVGTAPAREEPTVAAEQTLRSTELQQLGGAMVNDPMRAIQALPGVAAGDDFRSEFSVRGAGIQQMNFTFEGISTAFLLHTIQQVHDTGSIAMVNGEVLEEISISSGAYPQRYGNRTGAEVDFRMREGSRERVQSHVTVSLIAASAVVEGPLGASKRGSWVVAGRASYLDLIVSRLYPDQNLSFGFSDVQSKLTYDVSTRQQLQFALTAGQSRFERPADELTNPGNLLNADNRSAIGVLSWRYARSPRFAVTERVAIAANLFRNTSRDGPDLDNGDGRDLVYRTDWSYAPHAGVTFEGGGEARRSSASGREQQFTGGKFQLRESYNASAVTASAFAQARLTSASGAAIVPGVRIDHWSLTSDTAASPWIGGSLPIGRALTLRAGGGIYRQEPGFAELLGFRGTPTLAPERAYHADVGLEGRISQTLRWQTTVYNREDRDLLRLPNSEMRVVNGTLALASLTSHYVNALDGYARGVEWMVERRTPNGLSGWVSYALGFTRYRDRTTGEIFWGDFDQRHTINVYGNYRTSDRLSFSVRFRAGSDMPTPGYWAERAGGDFVGEQRNTLRVPVYSRLDARLNRTFTWEHKRLTLFVEALNAYNRSNVRFNIPSVDRRTFQATNLFETMLPFVPSIGVLLEF
jgi:hypothetical protein